MAQQRLARWGVTALVLLASAPAWAQPGGGTPGGTAGENNCGDAQLQPREHPNPQLDQKGADNPSDRLAQSGGVICPPSQVDPAIKAPTPNTGDKGVISPPQNPSVKPK